MEILIYHGENVLTSYYQSNTYENYNNFQCVSNHDHVLATGGYVSERSYLVRLYAVRSESG